MENKTVSEQAGIVHRETTDVGVIWHPKKNNIEKYWHENSKTTILKNH
jgi:hypothetical protein